MKILDKLIYGTHLPEYKLIWTAICISLSGSFHFGYQVFITNPGKQTFVEFVNSSMHDLDFSYFTDESLWGLIVAVFFIGAMFGLILAKIIGTKLSFKFGFFISNSIMVSAICLSVISKYYNSFILFAIARFFHGTATNLTIGLSAVFLTECSPKEWASSINMITGIFAQVGCISGTIVSMHETFGTRNLWWLIYGVEIFLLLPLSIWLFIMYDSPMHFLRNDDCINAKKSLLFYYGKHIDADSVLSELSAGVKNHRRILNMIEIFDNRSTIKGILIGIVANVAVAFSGIAVLNVYATDMLINNGLTHFQASITQIVQMSATIVPAVISSYCIKKYGERFILLCSNGGVLTCNILIVVFLVVSQTTQLEIARWLIVFTMIPLNMAYVFGVLPLSFFIATIFVDDSARLAAQSWGSFGQMLSRVITIAIYVPTRSLIGEPLAYFIYFVLTTLCAQCFFYKILHRKTIQSTSNC